MKLNKITKKQAFKTSIVLKDISEYTCKNGKKNIIIRDSNGDTYSAFETIWDNQHIKIDELNQGDTLEIVYYKNMYNFKVYKNFIKVNVLKKVMTKKDIDSYLTNNEETGISQDEAKQLLEEVFSDN